MIGVLQCDVELRSLLEEAEAMDGLKVVIYSPTNWAVEKEDGSKAFNFNPTVLTNLIRSRLRLVVKQDCF